ncbi:hypothetical protein KXR53_33950 [Inquilinus limosus]|uniref:hypothetical protein n=1 Tax=Inquilinus limosus TaxID=171674 RepID=UPI003F14C4D3
MTEKPNVRPIDLAKFTRDSWSIAMDTVGRHGEDAPRIHREFAKLLREAGGMDAAAKDQEGIADMCEELLANRVQS